MHLYRVTSFACSFKKYQYISYTIQSISNFNIQICELFIKAMHQELFMETLLKIVLFVTLILVKEEINFVRLVRSQYLLSLIIKYICILFLTMPTAGLSTLQNITIHNTHCTTAIFISLFFPDSVPSITKSPRGALQSLHRTNSISFYSTS